MKWVAVGGLCLILTAAAFVGGWVVGRVVPKGAADYYGVPFAPAPADWTEWRYPNAEVRGLAAGGATALGNTRVASAHTVQLVTPDSIELVLAFYAGQFGQPGMTNPSVAGTGSGFRGTARGQEVTSWAETVVARPGVKGKIISYRTSNYDVVVVVTRADAEKHTHVLLSYLPNP